jgi:hypothetical protein
LYWGGWARGERTTGCDGAGGGRAGISFREEMLMTRRLGRSDEEKEKED